MINLVIALFFAFAVSLVLIYFISAHDRRLKLKSQKGPIVRTTKTESAIEEDFRLFVKFCTELTEYSKLEITGLTRPLDDEVVIYAQSVNPITRVEYLVVGFYIDPTDTVELNKIGAISDQIVSERISKAILITPGRFPDTIHSLAELAPMEFIDGPRIEELKKKIIL